MQQQSNIKVGLRIRPPLPREQAAEGPDCGKWLQIRSGSSTVAAGGKEFDFDYCVPATDEGNQEAVWSVARELVDGWLGGLSAVIFAYGQTGSGKTYTITGTRENPGIVPRVIRYAFDQLAHSEPTVTTSTVHLTGNFTLNCSYIELYTNQLRDLLHDVSGSRQPPPPLRISEQRVGGGIDVKVIGARVIPIATANEGLALYDVGSAARTTSATEANEHSSRSHAIFTLQLDREVDTEGTGVRRFVTSKLHLVDLAGSERETLSVGSNGVALPYDEAADTAAKQTQHRRVERVGINSGLLELRRVITALAEGQTVVSYRGNKLTHLLRGALGGDALTLMLACVSPTEESQQESLRTLQYAARARRIVNRPSMVVYERPRSAAPVRAVSAGRGALQPQAQSQPTSQQQSPRQSQGVSRPVDGDAALAFLRGLTPTELGQCISDSYQLVIDSLPPATAAAQHAAAVMSVSLATSVLMSGQIQAQSEALLRQCQAATDIAQEVHRSSSSAIQTAIGALGAFGDFSTIQYLTDVMQKTGQRVNEIQEVPQVTAGDVQRGVRDVLATILPQLASVQQESPQPTPRSRAADQASIRASALEHELQLVRARLAASEERVEAIQNRATELELKCAGLEHETEVLRAQLVGLDQSTGHDVVLGAALSPAPCTERAATVVKHSELVRRLTSISREDLDALARHIFVSCRLITQRQAAMAAAQHAQECVRVMLKAEQEFVSQLEKTGMEHDQAAHLGSTMTGDYELTSLSKQLRELVAMVDRDKALNQAQRAAQAARDEADVARQQAVLQRDSYSALLTEQEQFNAAIRDSEQRIRGAIDRGQMLEAIIDPPEVSSLQRAAILLACAQSLQTSEARDITAPLLGKLASLTEKLRQAELLTADAQRAQTAAEDRAALYSSLSMSQ